MSIAIWNQTQFISRYPEFTAGVTVNPSYFASLFSEAGLYLNNTDGSPVTNIATRTILLNMITAHIAFIGGALTADGQPKPVGRVSQAAEGSVSASLEWSQIEPGTEAWFQQSQYGSAFWQATARWRRFRYSPRPTNYGQAWYRRFL